MTRGTGWFMPSDATKRREARNEEAKAKRGTDEWRAAGASLVADRKRAEEEAAKRAVDPFHGSDDEWELLTWEVAPQTLDKWSRRFERMLAEACSDSGYEPDQIAHEILDAFLAVEVLVPMKTEGATRRRIAVALELLRTQLGFPVSEAIAKLRGVR